MLWNKQNGEVESIIDLLHKQSAANEKKNLECIRDLHQGYQKQIMQLKSEKMYTQNRLEEATLLNEACLNTLRAIKKEQRKYKKIIKQMSEANNALRD